MTDQDMYIPQSDDQPDVMDTDQPEQYEHVELFGIPVALQFDD